MEKPLFEHGYAVVFCSFVTERQTIVNLVSAIPAAVLKEWPMTTQLQERLYRQNSARYPLVLTAKG